MVILFDTEATARFKKSVKRIKKQKKDLQKLKQETLDAQYKDHGLQGNLSGLRECHIEPDWLLVYKKVDGCLILFDTGSHEYLFT